MLKKMPDGQGLEYELKPCPFCGQDVADFFMGKELSAEDNWGDETDVVVICSRFYGGCGAASGMYPTGYQAGDAWNRRAACSVAEIRKALEEIRTDEA